MSVHAAAQSGAPAPVVDCQCPRYTLGQSTLTLLKALNLAIGSIAVVTFLLVAEAAARAEMARQPPTSAGSWPRLVTIAVILAPNMALLALLWRTGWGAWLHERLHGLLMRCLGVRPTYGVFLRGRGIRGEFCMPAEPHLFGRAGFAAITLAPGFVLFVLGLALSIASPYSVVVSIALAWQIGSCSGDLLFAWHLWRARAGARIEDLGNTMLVHQLSCARRSLPDSDDWLRSSQQ